MLSWLKVLAVLFVLPVFAAVFFHFAPQIQNGQLVEAYIKQIKESELNDVEKAERTQFASSLRVDQMCFDNSAESRDLIGRLQVADLCETFQHYFWAELFSGFLILLGLLHLTVTFFLAQTAKKSSVALLRSFRMSWTSATAFSLLILAGQTALGAYTFFYVTVVFTDHYLPKLILALIIGGGWAFFQIAKLLLTKTKIEPEEPTSEEISEQDAPKLWSEVRDVAKRLDTAPPDSILLGMSTSFYVTEFPVRHASGITKGRTLHLSAPMMKVLPKDELLAIIGHELGHFKGEDTVMTRHLTPLLVKSEGTMAHLWHGGLIAAPALHAMNVFHYLFEKVISAYRRERELHADAFGARVTHPETMAASLVRYVYQSEIYTAAFREHLATKSALDASLSKFQDLLSRDDGYWDQMSKHAPPHPFDTHPPLTVRLEKLGMKVDDVRHKAIKPVTTSSYDVLISGKSDVASKAFSEHANLVADAQNRLSIKEAAADQLSPEVINRHFPQVVLKARTWRVAMIAGFVALLMIGLPAIIIATTLDTALPAVTVLVGLVGLSGFYFTWLYWRNNYNQTLTLNHLGIQLTSWREMLKFEDVKEIRHVANNGVEQIVFQFKEKRVPLARKPILPGKRKAVSVDFATFEGKQRDNVVRVFRYYTREIEG